VDLLYLADIRLPLERANGLQTVSTCHALAARGHRVTLLVRPDTAAETRDPLAFYDLPPIDGLTIARVPVAGPAPLRRAHYLAAAVKHSLAPPRPTVIFTRDLGVAALLARVPRAGRPPLLYESHGYAPTVSALMPTLHARAASASTAKLARLERRERRVWASADGYVTLTAVHAEELADRFGPRAALAVVPDGARLPADRVFTWTGPRATRPVVAYAGHLYPWKGVDVLIEALALVPEVAGRIVGGHPRETDLGRVTALAAARGLGSRVVFTGLLPPHEVAGAIAEADILVLPNTATEVSARYTSPLKLFEYLAAGRPIVASRLPALAEVLEDGVNALLVAPEDPQALADAIRRLAADPALALRLAARAFADAERYSWARRAERLDVVLARTLPPTPST
jgi:glycosyltransferase involved in cell wall biosynthesis